MKKVFKYIILILSLVFISIQFIPTELNMSDEIAHADFIKVNKMPEVLGNLLKTTCYDCHSNNTNYPWYNKVQPIAWFLEQHIEEGKAELNFNEWEEYSDRRKTSKLNAISKQIEKGDMPLSSYALIHRDANLSNDDKQLLIDYMGKLKENLN